MTELRQKMIECLQLRGLSERTQESYVRAVRQLAEHYHRSPNLITEEELRQYFLHLKNVKRYSRNTMTIAICGIRFLYQHALNRDWSIFGIVRPAPEKKLPVILSVAEVRKVLSAKHATAARVQRFIGSTALPKDDTIMNLRVRRVNERAHAKTREPQPTQATRAKRKRPNPV